MSASGVLAKSFDRNESILTRDAVALYKALVANPERPETELAAASGLDPGRLPTAFAALHARGLLRRSSGPRRPWIPVGPEHALADLLAEEEQRLRRREQMLHDIRAEILRLKPTYTHALQSRLNGDVIEVVPGQRRSVIGLLALHAQQTNQQVAAACPDFLDINTFADSVLSHCASTVAVRIVISEQGSDSAITTTGSAQLEIRTVPATPLWMIVFDNRIALLPAGCAGGGMAVVRHPAVVMSLAAEFNLLWEWGMPLPSPAKSCGEVLEDIRRDVLQLLAAGHKDEVIARRLGLSVRTCRRHIADIIDRLGATSRFQAGVLAQRHLIEAPTFH